jgi:hypothetical protein
VYCRRGVLIAFFVVVFSLSVFALNDGGVSLSANSYYESVNSRFVFAVSNSDSDAIGDITLVVPGSPVSYSVLTGSLTEPDNYVTSFVNDALGSPKDLRWAAVLGGVDDAVQYFRFNATAALVDSDEELVWVAKLLDNDGDLTQIEINFTVFNDDTAPVISEVYPASGDYVREGTSDQLVRINVTDPETGIKSATFDYYLCDTSNVSQKDLDCVGESCTTVIDLSSFEDSDEICFEYEVSNNALETVTYTGRITIDGLAPWVELHSPEDDALLGAQHFFIFTPHDNLADTLYCELLVDDVSVSAGYFENDVAANFSTVGLSEGEHQWSISCEDGVGFVNSTEQRTVTLDLTAPEVSGLSPANASILAQGDFIYVNVTDNYELRNVSIVLEGNSSLIVNTLGEGVFALDTSSLGEGTFSFGVVASDAAGNSLSHVYVYVIDLTAPSLEIVSPADGVETDHHVQFVVNVTDNYDSVLDCELFVDGVSVKEISLASGVLSEFSETLDLGNRTWFLRCEDDVGNSDDSDDFSLMAVDLSGPTIVITALDLVTRDGDVDFEATITDISGVDSDSVEGIVYDADNTSYLVDFVHDSGDVYTGTLTLSSAVLLGEYVLELSADDTLGNSAVEDELFEVTYNYDIDFSFADDDVTKGASVSLTGTVYYDNGSDVPEDSVQLTLPGDDEVVDLVDGEFTHSFNAPTSVGDYDVVASVSAENELTYSHSDSFEVYTLGGSSGGNKDGDKDENNGADSVGGGSWVAKPSTVHVQTPSESEPESSYEQASEPEDKPAVKPKKEKPLVVAKKTVVEDLGENSVRAVGGAWAFFKDFLSAGIVWWVILLLVAIVLGLYLLSKSDITLGLFKKSRKKEETPNHQHHVHHVPSASNSHEKFRARIR